MPRSLLAAALLLAIVIVACRSPQRVVTAPGVDAEAAIRACLDAKSVAREQLAREAPTCSADWQCRPVMPNYLACSVIAPRNGALERTLGAALLEACTGVASRAGDCRRRGDCVDGRCVAASASFEPDACTVAAAAVSSWADRQEQWTCASDGDCAVVRMLGKVRPVGAAAWAGAPDELRGAVARCEDPDATGSEGVLRPACSEGGRCTLEPQRKRKYTKPSVDLECVRRELALCMRHRAGVAVTVAFAVSPAGRAGLFTFSEMGYGANVDPALEVALAESILRCPISPATADGAPIEMRVVVPFRFVSP